MDLFPILGGINPPLLGSTSVAAVAPGQVPCWLRARSWPLDSTFQLDLRTSFSLRTALVVWTLCRPWLQLLSGCSQGWSAKHVDLLAPEDGRLAVCSGSSGTMPRTAATMHWDLLDWLWNHQLCQHLCLHSSAQGHFPIYLYLSKTYLKFICPQRFPIYLYLSKTPPTSKAKHFSGI